MMVRMTAEQREARQRWPLGQAMLLDTGGTDERTGEWMHWTNPSLLTGKPGRPRRRPRGAQTWQEMLNAILADGVQISNTTTSTAVCPDFSIPAYYMAPGRVLRITAGGKCSNTTTATTLTYRLLWAGAQVLLTSDALILDTTARTDFSWYLSMMVVCRTEGNPGSFMTMGVVNQNNGLQSAAQLQQLVMPKSSPASVNTVNTTAASLLSLMATFSSAVSPTNLTCVQRIIEALN
jgi:hypothetical protein